jgi:Domain of unknown function (DUF1707)
MLASNADREAVAERLQLAFAEHRLTDDEFDHRIQLALTARTGAELDRLTADLPALPAVAPTDTPARAATKPGKLALAVKGPVVRAGQWRVPDRLTCLVYKGTGRLDLSSAELTAGVTTIRAIAYKSTIHVTLPPGVRLEATGAGVCNDYSSDEQANARLGLGGPVIRIKGLAYKGTIAISGAAIR